MALENGLGRGFISRVRAMRAVKQTETAELRKSTELSAGANNHELKPAIDASGQAEMSDSEASAAGRANRCSR
jgi:hypothetical protein